MDDILRFIGLAKKAGHLEIGEQPVSSAARAHSARLFLIASDAADNTASRAERFRGTGKAVLFHLPYTKQELGDITGRNECALLALTNIGFASSLADKLEALHPEKYAEGAAELRRQRQRVKQRGLEQKRHDSK